MGEAKRRKTVQAQEFAKLDMMFTDVGVMIAPPWF